MNRLITGFLLAAVMMSLGLGGVCGAEPQLAHMVFFKLKDSSDGAKEKLVTACNKYLSGHEGTVYYSAGVIAADMDRDVNVRDFDVSLHLVFKNKKAHDTYQKDPRHLKFVADNKQFWENVRVFDSYVAAPPGDR
jgi:hypothetical protein